MKIETKLNIGDKGYFLVHGKVRESIIIGIETRTQSKDQTWVIYRIKENPAGSQYTTYFNDNDIFATKEELLKNL